MRLPIHILHDWLVEYYKWEFPNVSPEFKVQTIEYVIRENHNIFDEKYVKDRQHFCDQCGYCCRIQMPTCPYFDDKTNKCISHDNQISFLCDIYPRPGEYGLDLTINCRYSLRIFIEFLDKVFEKKEKEVVKNGEEK